MSRVASEDREAKLLFKPALLLTESSDDFDALRVSVEGQIRPRNIIERFYSADVVALEWEILRLRRCCAGVVNLAFKRALKLLLRHHFEANGQADELVDRWFTEPEAKKEVREILARCSLDEFAVEAEALRLSLPDLEKFDRTLALESRRNKAIRCIDDYRAGYGKQCRERSNPLFRNSEVLSLAHRSTRGA